MEAAAAIGVASAIVTFIDLGAKLIHRIEELSRAGDLPKAFRDIRTRLPLIIGIISRTQDAHENLPEDAKQALEAVVQSCFKQINELEDILQKFTIGSSDSKIKRGLLAAQSLIEETRVQRIAVNLSDNVQLLMALNTAHVEKEKPAIARGVTEAPPSYAKTTGLFLLPFNRDQHFIGRAGILAELEKMYTQQKRVALAGIGGVGKSQVAIEYAFRFKEVHSTAHVFWVYGGTIARYYQGYKRIAQKLELPSWDDPDVSILELVSDWFSKTTDPYLLVLDNADNIAHYWPGKYKSASSLDDTDTNLARYLPDNSSEGHVLITTRDSRIATRLAKDGKPIILEAMAMDEAKQLFLSRVENDELVADEKPIVALIAALDMLPLAITQAAAFIDENFLPVSEYLSMLESDDAAEEILVEELDDSRRDEESINSVFRTWKISFDQISKQKPRAAEILSLLAVLDRQSIPRWLFSKMPEATTSIGLLISFHMVTARAGSQTYQLHRLVARFVQLSLRRAGTMQQWQDKALACVSKIYPVEIGVGEWPTCEALAPHVHILTQYEYKTTEARLDLAHLLCWAADFDIERGMYVQALQRAKKSLELFQELLPESDNRLASSTWLYGRLVYYEAKSEADLEQAASILREALRISSPHTLNYAETAFELAHICYAQGREEECLEMGKASFECWMAMEGKQSVRTLDNMHDYALELAMFGHEEEAIAKWQEILDLCPKSDASDNTKTVYTYRSLASIAEFQGDAQLSEQIYVKLIALCTKIYNSEHIHVFDYRLSHAEQILRQGRTEEAMALAKDMLEHCKNKSEWRIMLSCYEIMAECCMMTGDVENEVNHRIKCHELHSKFLGPSHKESISAADALARSQLCEVYHCIAVPLHEQILKWRENTLGSAHADTLSSLEYIGICKNHQEEDAESERIFTEVLERRPDPEPRVLDNLCTSLWNQQKWPELEVRCRQALELDSEYRLGAHWMLISALEKQGKMEEALALRAMSLQIEDNSHDSTELRRDAKDPIRNDTLDRRFGRIIHPRTWSA